MDSWNFKSIGDINFFDLSMARYNITEEKTKTIPPDIGIGKECDFLPSGISNIL